MARIRTNGIEIEYDVFGAPDAPAVLLVMGLGAQLTAWDDRICLRIAEAGFRAIRFDNRDAGLSTQFDEHCPEPLPLLMQLRGGQEVPAPYSLRDMAADAVGMLDALEIESAHVVGASMGGMIAQRMALHYEERVSTLTSIMSTTGNPELPSPDPEVVGLLLTPPPDEEEAALAAGVERARRLFGTGFPFDAERARERVRLARQRAMTPKGTLRQMLAVVSDGNRAPELNRVTTPTLVIHGDEDPLVPIAGGRDTAESIPSARLVEIPGMGHALPEGAWPTMFEEMLRLWRS